MKSHELRGLFLRFFEAPPRQHRIVESDSLIPSGDPTVLFTSAGMNQFKEYFLGKRTDTSRAASCQKCLRTGDLERVGKTASHHSFFEMLGNFSFGDYFKPEAIAWAWEFLTGTMNYAGTEPSATPDLCLPLPAEKLWISVYGEDEEAFRLWRKLGVPEEKIRRFGQSENFWPANAPKEGPNGPCGPCSEIYFDAEGKVEGQKSVEVWNLVFTQFDRRPDGSLKPLPKPNIDTGMGLERLTSVVQGTETDYETDLFWEIMNALRDLTGRGKARTEQTVFAERAIADHARAVVFLIADGVRPSNEGRGYVLRMLIRRVTRLAHRVLGLQGKLLTADRRPVFWAPLADAVRTAMANSPYHEELVSQRAKIQRIVDQEEAQFVETLASGTSRLDELFQKLKRAKTTVLSGDEAFKLYDTYGFPLELTIDAAQEHGFTVDRTGFDAAMKVQQERSRAGSQFGGDVFVTDALQARKQIPGLPPKEAQFVGYDEPAAETLIKGLWDGAAWVTEAHEGQAVGVILERSPFYGEAGGQVGDRGTIEGAQGLADVEQTTWADDVLVHHARVRRGRLRVGDAARAQVDAQRRLQIARSHTATHLLHWALRKVLGPEAVQAGSFVEANRIRFDFSSLQPLREEQRGQVETLVGARIRLADAVITTLKPIDEARREGALALFGEKYGQTVRVVTIGDYSKELCGGTHLRHTGFVGEFAIVGESSIAAGTRRIDVVVGEAAQERHLRDSRSLRTIAAQLSRPPEEALQAVEELLLRMRTLEKQLKATKQELAQAKARELLGQAKRLDGANLIAARLDGADRELLAALADSLRESLQDGVVLLASAEASAGVAWVMAVSPGLVKRGVHAGKLLKPIAALTQGGGGGRPEFAQAGGKDPSKISEALGAAEGLIREALKSP
ncbi:MAG: alanine--tRNA ligase [Candidatus Omnitrophica bacterium]|nr:alanine--tRNA ligase [Candidatus Omnitrophota bacterium]